MANNIAVSITADVADLQVKRAILTTELKAATKDLNGFARQAKATGTTDELRTQMLASADAAGKARSQLALNGAELKKLSGDTGGAVASGKAFIAQLKEEAAIAGMSRAQLLQYRAAKAGMTEEAQPYIDALGKQNKAHLSSRATLEPLILVHEALAGNWKRFAGSAMIEAQAVAGAEKSAAALKAVLSPTGLAIGAVAAVMITGAIAAEHYDEAQAQLTATVIGAGAASGLTAAQLSDAAAQAATAGGLTKTASLEAAEAFAAAGVRSQETIAMLAGSIETYAALTGQKAPEAQKALAEAMQDPVRGAKELHDQLGILDGDQLKQIATLTAQGDKFHAVEIIAGAYRKRIDDAREAGVGATGVFGDMKDGLSHLVDWFGQAASAAGNFAEKINIFENLGAAAPQLGVAGAWLQQRALGRERSAANAGAVQRRAAQTNRDNAASAAGAELADAIPEQQDAARRTELTGKVAVLSAAIAAETRLHGAHSEAVQRDTAALAEYKRALDTVLPVAEKKHRLAQLDEQLAEAKHGHDKGKVAELTRQRSVLEQAGEVKGQGEVDQQAADAASLAQDRTHEAKGKKGPDIVSQWQEQLRAQQVASTDYFKDATADELKFWQGKLALTAKGSHDWIEVQGHIYEASRTLARQDYQDHVAAIDEKIEADRADWSKQQADWQEKLAYIKSKYGEQAAEYKTALKELERAGREHDKQELADTERSIREQLSVLKGRFDAQERVRSIDAQGAEAAIKDRGGSQPLGEVHAAGQTGALHAQLNQQKLADLDSYHSAEAAKLDAAIAAAAAKYHGDESQYRQLLDAKTKADEDYANRKAELEAQARQQSIQDINAVKQAYHGYIDGLVGETVTGLDGVISHQKSWAQMGAGIYQSLAGSFEKSIEKMLSNWIVTHLLMTAAQRTQIAAQTATHIGGEVAKTGATVVGGEARVVATASASGQAAAITGMHNLKEITSHAAAAAAGAYHAMAAIPVVGPVLGAAAAAATFTAVEAFGVLASFAQGTNELPRDMVANIHAGERIVPRADNAKLLAAVDRGTGAGGRGGDTHHWHYNPVVNGQMPFADQLEAHESNMVAMFRRAQRNGALRAA